MKRKYILNSPRIEELKKKKHKVLERKIVFFFFCFLLILVSLTFLSRWQKLNIDTIQIFGNQVIETQNIKSVVKENLVGHYFWLFPKTNFLLYPKKQIKNKLADKFKRLADISINTDKIKTLQISVSEREGKYLWCGTLIPTLVNNTSDIKCYFMDKDGYIFDEAPYFSGAVYSKFYGSTGTTAENPSGIYFLKENFTKIISFENILKEMGLNPTAFWLDDNNEGNISLSGEPMAGPRIIFKMDSDYEKIAQNLQAAISTEPLQTDLKNKFASLLYLDLRFGNKVYYKFK